MLRGVAVISVVLTGGGWPAAAVAAPPSFSDVTVAAGIDAQYDGGPFEYSGGGTAGDFNRDGFQDLFVLGGGYGAHGDYLYINNGDGTFTNRAPSWGLTGAHAAQGAAAGDFNGDGWLDIYVTSYGPVGGFGPCHNRLYRNNGGAGFTEVAFAAGVDCTGLPSNGGGAAFGDYDLDGDLDLFVAAFLADNKGTKLFRNNGDETFTDVTHEAAFFDGVDMEVKGFAPRFIDMDGDRYPEMLLVGDFGTSRYYRNNADGTFSDLTASSGTGLDHDGMGQTVGDFNGDLQPDWYVTAIYNSQDPTNAPGNKLYLNLGRHHYVEVASSAGVDQGGYGWGTVAVDFDHDMRLDIAETNGSPAYPTDQSHLWMNNGDGTFSDMASTSGFLHNGQGRGMVNFDYDNDGDQDVAILAYNENVRLFRNNLNGQVSRWLRVLLDTSAVPDLAPDGIGSRVLVTAGGVSQVRHISTGDNFFSHSELSAHFGVDVEPVASALEVVWPNGGVTLLSDLATSQTVTLMAPGPVSCTPAPPEVAGLRLGRANDGADLVFTWDDLPVADGYRVFADSDPSGGFPLVMVTADSGRAGVAAPVPPGAKFFLVAARAGSCWGPK